MLEKLLLENDLVACSYDAKDWKDAVTKGVNLLENGDFVEKDEYLNSIFASTEENGPYYVIAPQIALPHSRPEDGVKNVAISVVTLKTPIVFNHKENDPVELVICLAAKDGDSHLQLMQQVGTMLFNEQAIKDIIASKNDEELKSNIIKSL